VTSASIQRVVRAAAVAVALAACNAVPSPTTRSNELAKALPSPPVPAPTVVATSTATVLQGPRRPELNSVDFAPDARHGWIGGAGIILGTADAGLTWQVQWTGGQTVNEIRILDAEHAWAVAVTRSAGDPATRASLLRTIDAGRHWTATPLDPRIGSLDFVSSAIGWSIESGGDAATCGTGCGPAGTLLRTVDGGRTWLAGGPPAARAVCFVNAAIGYAVSDDHLFATSDGGRSWERRAALPTGDGEGVGWMSCPGSTVWLMLNLDGGAGGHINYAGYRSTDGGRHLSQVLANSFYPDTPAGVATADAEPGPMVAPDGATAIELGSSPAAEETSVTITHDAGRTWTTVPLEGVVDQGSAVAFPDGRHGWLASNRWGRGEILATSDGGRTWHLQFPSPAPRPVADISFVSATHGFGLGIAGDSRAVLETLDGGRSWSVVTDLPEDGSYVGGPVFGGGKALSFADTTQGWVATASGHLFETIDGGRTWARVAGVPAGDEVDGVGLGRGGHGCIAISDPASPSTTELRTADDGASWTPVGPYESLDVCASGKPGAKVADSAALALAPPLNPVFAFASEETAWAFMGATGFGRTSDGGATWTQIQWPPGTDQTGAPISSSVASFGDQSHGWLLTSDGSIYRTHDAGSTWSEIP
jgi:photosystem II stability/assembly factor-like uncharacterized protein